jgi:hypothetical protein
MFDYKNIKKIFKKIDLYIYDYEESKQSLNSYNIELLFVTDEGVYMDYINYQILTDVLTGKELEKNVEFDKNLDLEEIERELGIYGCVLQ